MRNAGALALVQVANYASSLLVLIHLTRVLGVERYGVVAFSIGITQMLSVILDLGFAMSATKHISEIRDDRDGVARFIGAVFVLKLCAFILGAVGLLCYAMMTSKYAAHTALLAWSILPLLGHALQPIWLYQGIERMRFVTVFTVLAKLSFVALVMLLVGSERDYARVPLADGIAQAAAAAVGLLLIRRVGYAIVLPTVADLRSALRMTTGFFVSRVAATLQANAGVVLLGLVAAPASVAIYALAEQLYRAMHAVFAPVTHALYPYMSRERDLRLLLRVTAACTTIAVIGSLLGYIIGPAVIPRLLGSEWASSLPVLDVFFVGIVVHVVVLMAGYPLAAALNRLDVANASVVVATVLQAIGAGILIALGLATPVAFAWLLVVSEVYLLIHCGVLLIPQALRQFRYDGKVSRGGRVVGTHDKVRG